MFRFCGRHALLSGLRLVFGLNSAVLILPFGALDACAAQPALPTSAASMAIPVTTIQKGNFSGVREPLQAIIRTPAEWESLWKRHASIQSPTSPLPAVDFGAEIVVGIFLGEKSAGGYEVEITRAELKDSVLYVYYVEKSPKPGGAAIQALTQPFHLVKLPRTDARVVFSRISS